MVQPQHENTALRPASAKPEINPVPETRNALLDAHQALWGINLRRHRGDNAFRAEINAMRTRTAELIEAMEAAEEAREASSDRS